MADNKPDESKKRTNWFRLFGQGAISGGSSVLLGIGLYQVLLVGVVPYLLLVALMGAVVIGLLAGGIGGLIAGNIWNHDKAATLGGIILALILLAIGIGFAPFFLLGGY